MNRFWIVLAALSIGFGLLSCGSEKTTTPTGSNMTNVTQSNAQPDASMIQAQPGQGGDHHSEQIIFSGTGNSDIGPFGFWIWSQDEDANSPEYAGEAAGAMYFYAAHLTKGVEGEVEEIGAGQYQITVDSRKDSSIHAVLINTPPVVQGPNNTVDVDFTTSSGGGHGTSTNAVVNVTGPED